ncbi:hypothetical protein BKA08_003138 [Nocardioides marinisabuli]|uniref:Uncharacterized protein n=1 Tax=Nocardioides marinisabuli TaxID=419476 RepID=A0A7Y9JRV8_9ACTN|nr:hypothetical protein [Nocardioides marinisabuli]NYD58900.1 hypothetical protein [Nocardioides marinisabuli]
MRTFVACAPEPGDAEALAELRRDDLAPDGALSLYLLSKTHEEAIVTLTGEGDLVLGLGIDDPLNGTNLEQEAAALMAQLRQEFAAAAGLGGVELAPPQSEAEWREEGLVLLREGNV